MPKTEIRTSLVPSPIGSYSQAVRHGDTLYLAGQVGLDAATRTLVSEDVTEQTRQTLRNLGHVIAAAGGSLNDLVTVRVFISDQAEFAGMNLAYGEFFEPPYPARTTVSTGLAPGLKVEIDGIAVLGG